MANTRTLVNLALVEEGQHNVPLGSFCLFMLKMFAVGKSNF